MHRKLLALLLALTGSLLAQTTPSPVPGATSRRPFTFEDMMKLKRVGAPVPSPDGKWIVFDAVDVDLEANTKISHLWIVPAAGGEARRLNQTPNHEERPRFSPDGKRLINKSRTFPRAQTVGSGRRTGRALSSCRQFIRRPRTTPKTKSATRK
jgi:dipeptidyl aminopeptidase/acylaminoacyl peptidase